MFKTHIPSVNEQFYTKKKTYIKQKERININQLNNNAKALLERYLAAANNLYGIVPLSKILSIYNSQNEPISDEEFLNYIDEIDLSDKHYDIVGEDEFFNDVGVVAPIERDLIAEYLIIDDDLSYYYDVKEGQLGKPYYVPEKSKLLKYEDEFYHEKTLSFISLRAFFRNQSSLTKERADEITEDIYGSANVFNGDVASVVHLIERIFEFDKSTLEEFIPLYIEMFNDTRLHCNCGYTPNEMLKLF